MKKKSRFLLVTLPIFFCFLYICVYGPDIFRQICFRWLLVFRKATPLGFNRLLHGVSPVVGHGTIFDRSRPGVIEMQVERFNEKMGSL